MPSWKVQALVFLGGTFSWVSDLYGGSISDDDQCDVIDLLSHLPPNCRLLADKGYRRLKLAAAKTRPDVVVCEPPTRLAGVNQLSATDVQRTASIAPARVMIENKFALVKGIFAFVDGRDALPASLGDLMSSAFRVCCFLTNFLPLSRNSTWAELPSVEDCAAKAPSLPSVEGVTKAPSLPMHDAADVDDDAASDL